MDTYFQEKNAREASTPAPVTAMCLSQSTSRYKLNANVLIVDSQPNVLPAYGTASNTSINNNAKPNVPLLLITTNGTAMSNNQPVAPEVAAAAPPPRRATSSYRPPPPSTHTITRSQVRSTTQLIITQILRQSLTTQERNRALLAGRHVDEATLTKLVAAGLEMRRRYILRQSHLFDRIFYMKANVLSDYYCMETLEHRVHSLGTVFAQRARDREFAARRAGGGEDAATSRRG